ncbi:MAG: phosphotransferase [Candidatus Zixiibacteriota bacterium]
MPTEQIPQFRDIVAEIVDEDQLSCIEWSARKFLRHIATTRRLAAKVYPHIRRYSNLPINLKLVSLERVGAAPGFSGATVTIGYFYRNHPDDHPSNPMVLKISRPTIKKGRLFDKLNDEWNRAMQVASYAGQDKSNFAFPIHLDKANQRREYSVLWSPFFSSKAFRYRPLLGLRVSSLANVLRGKETLANTSLSEFVTTAFDRLDDMHFRIGSGRLCRRRNILCEYKRYLRGWSRGEREKWAAIWGPHTEQMTKQFGRSWTNPIWLMDQLRYKRPRLTLGAVHGDIHPLNIIIQNDRSPGVIDFGWAEDESHVAKDFVLMECNFRFVFLKPDIPFSAILKLSRAIGGNLRSELNSGSAQCDEYYQLIKDLRELAIGRLGEGSDFDIEYVLPLFLTAFGLLRHLDSFENQVSAHLTVLGLSDYCRKNVLPKLTGT